jgi:hypothetical protein
MNTETISASALAIVAGIDWDRGYFTREECTAIETGFRNPFRVERLTRDLEAVRRVENISTADFSDTARECTRLFGNGQTLDKPLEAMAIALDHEICEENKRANIVRAFGFKRGPDEAWRLWIVLTREGSKLFPTEKACANLWAGWGFDAAASPQSEYSPTGRMFQGELHVRRASNSCAILTQSGARDV